ncbi:MAG TPA: FAD-binding protein [Thermoleophilia bacterium]|nr:FAD-binding protein [Thermoleophilia bacterium]
MSSKTERSTYAVDPSVTTADVLVIGGGFAGCFAAIKAAEAGADVVMAVKGQTGRSGLTPWANSWFVFRDTKGVSRADYLRQFQLSGEYLSNMDFVDILMAESYDRYAEVSSWGARTGREYYYQAGTVSRSIEVLGSGDAMRKKAVAVGVRLLERVMITSLIKPEDRVVGAIGFHMESGRPHAVVAKATVMCAGPASFKPLGMGYPCSSATADGDAMAYRAGAEISGKEFNDGHPARKSNPLSGSGPADLMKSELELGGGPPSAPGPVEHLDGARLGMRIQASYGVHDGGVPIDPGYVFSPGSLPGGQDGEPIASYASLPGFSTPGMSNHKAEGVFPQDLFGASNVPGLWAAGDGLSSMQNGAGYAGFGCSCAGSAVQGARAGRAAAESAKGQTTPLVAKALVRDLAADMLAPLTRPRGYSPAWVTRLLQNTMFPYYVMYVKEKGRLDSALSQIMYLQHKYAPELKVEDPHGLRLAHETRNMLLNAEMKLRAGLAREESRGTHYREDFPFRDDDDWLCWVKLVESGGRMVAVKHPIPLQWRPDPSLPYREKYPVVFPSEERCTT